ncbi:MAG: hypothetical protein ABIJ61_10330, partial [bacterium]
GPVGDTLTEMIVAAAERAGRPVYLAKTLYSSPKINALRDGGRDLGLVTLVTKSQESYSDQLKSVYGNWIEQFRTGGLDSWRLRAAPETDGGRMLATNYAPAIAMNLKAIREQAPDLRAELFRWYLAHVEPLLNEQMKYTAAQNWCCQAADVAIVESWCKQQGIECKESMEE